MIVWPVLTFEPGEGLVCATLPSGTVSEATLLELTSHFRPSASTALRASSGLIPTRLSGRVTESGPDEIVTRTVAPFSAWVPPAGSVEATESLSTVSEATLSGLSSQVRPAASIWDFASA